jgi:molecular chaperone GrpE
MNSRQRDEIRKSDEGRPKVVMPDEAVGVSEADASTLAAENASLRDRLLRALADAENTRRQAERTASDARQYAVSDFARELLAVADNLQRAIAAAERQPLAEDAPLIEGVRGIDRLLASIFERFGVRRIAALGEPFDPNLHEAMMELDETSGPPGTVASVLEDGYTIHDRLVRPARVAVVKRGANSSQTSEGEAPGIVPQIDPPNHHR